LNTPSIDDKLNQSDLIATMASATIQTLSPGAFQPTDTNSGAQLREHTKLLHGIDVARWHIQRNTVTYQRPDSHTLSLYLSGGESSYRADQQSLHGAPGRLCLMPQDHRSHWHINGDIEFIHLYFSDDMLKGFAASQFATDVRFVELREVIYEDDRLLARLMQRYFMLSHCDPSSSPLLAEELIYQVMHHLMLHYNGYEVRDDVVTGGLSPAHRRRVATMIDDDLAAKHRLHSLAADVNLSPFHFARMFKQSFGESPAAYITRQRIHAVKRQLKSDLPLAEISQQLGFSQQSHMTKTFKALTGLTPHLYRQRL
jgi:AraC family transcriptional regulator